MLATSLTTESLFRILQDPSTAGSIVDGGTVGFAVKVILLVILFFYVLFALTAFVQTRRLQRWLPLLRGKHYTTATLIHLVLAGIGWLLAFFVL